MPRERLRVCLQDGLKLDLNRLIRRGFVRLGECTGPIPIQWLNSDTGEVRASGSITADLRDDREGWLHFMADNLDQRLTLAARPRHFGGRQWYSQFLADVSKPILKVLRDIGKKKRLLSMDMGGHSILPAFCDRSR